MTTPAAPSATGSASRAEALLASFAAAGYAAVQPSILQPAEPFLDLSGEDIRKSLYLTTDASGDELCLRPDLTIPVARDYLASAARRPAGGLLLSRTRVPLSRRQAERVRAGRRRVVRTQGHSAAADAEMLALGLEATAAFGITDVEIRTGDVGLFAALIGALDLAPVWKRRLMKDFNRKISLAQDLQRMTLATSASRTDYHGVLAALGRLRPQGRAGAGQRPDLDCGRDQL